VDRTTPLIARGNANKGRGCHYKVVAVIIGAQLMKGARNLCRAPGLIDPEIADEVGDLLGRIVAAAAAKRLEAVACRGVGDGGVVAVPLYAAASMTIGRRTHRPNRSAADRIRVAGRKHACSRGPRGRIPDGAATHVAILDRQRRRDAVAELRRV